MVYMKETVCVLRMYMNETIWRGRVYCTREYFHGHLPVYMYTLKFFLLNSISAQRECLRHFSIKYWGPFEIRPKDLSLYFSPKATEATRYSL